jgi:hypothetical protein
MFPNDVMMRQQTWNDILAAMIAVRDAHGWQEGNGQAALPEREAAAQVVRARKPAARKPAKPKAKAKAKPAKKSARKVAKVKAKKAAPKKAKAKATKAKKPARKPLKKAKGK